MNGALMALTESFPDRMILGLGVSHRDLVRDVRGHAYDRPLEAMRSFLEAMDAAPFTGLPPVTPTTRVLGALGPKMLQLAAQKTNGAHPYLVTPDHTAGARGLLGVDPLLCPEQMLVLDHNVERAHNIARSNVAAYLGQPNYAKHLLRMGFAQSDVTNGGSERLARALVAWGSIDNLVDRVREHFDAGADHVCIQTLAVDRHVLALEQWRELGTALASLQRPRAKAT
jgi:probable F420-dependent oxidoreductase